MKEIKSALGLTLGALLLVGTSGYFIGKDTVFSNDIKKIVQEVKLLASVSSFEKANFPKGIEGEELESEYEGAQLNNALLSSEGEEQVEISVKRRALLERIAPENPELFLGLRMYQEKLKEPSEKVLENLEKEVEVSGTVNILQIDDFQNPAKSHKEYVLQTKEESIPLYVAGELEVGSGAEVTVQGLKLGTFIVADARLIKLPPKIVFPFSDTIGDQKTLVILADFLQTPVPFTKRDAENIVFNGQFQAFMKEQSYNRISFSGLVTEWIPIKNGNNPYFSCAAVSINTPEVKDYILNNKIDLSKYGRVIYMIGGGNAVGGCSFVGKTNESFNGNTYRISQLWVGLKDYDAPSPFDMPQTTIKWTELDYLLSHEMGHALGLSHANRITCVNAIFTGDCVHREYGNVFDVMGFAFDSLHFNASFKEKMGWLDNTSLITINKTGTYTINSLEKGPIKAAKIQMEGTNTYPYYIELRQPIGFDRELSNPSYISNIEGLLINYVGEGKYQNTPQLLDFSPGSSNAPIDFAYNNSYTLNQAPKKLGSIIQSIYNDPGTGISIGPVKKNSVDNFSLNVGIQSPTCLRRDPLISSYWLANSLPVTAGTSVYLATVAFSNHDSLPCGSSEFELTSPRINYTTEFLAPSNLTTYPVDAFASSSITMDVASYVRPGTYTFPINLTNTRSGISTYIGDATIVVQ